jgi:hypothetical protein
MFNFAEKYYKPSIYIEYCNVFNLRYYLIKNIPITHKTCLKIYLDVLQIDA